ncbi:SUKH-4 family immunity protein [Acaryochloris sp. 'Moss Beach']|uniref:SUKH-4 family immunity protein n=1 Tax=Acaryochloris sp. 'Moss Beach' TaxID=2740837 RepID=UPI001F31E1A3|nr:SUKH-4 family immunity protein [Acaryochloris sp. 'Moss Beach']UJB70629.1 SUKH-4 family immunity protein [Acaryochloris sp. 'Moss Beach']
MHDMTPSEFKSRFIKSLPPIPPNIELELDRFIIYSPERVSLLGIPDEHKAFLLESGLPADAAPFLNFNNDDHSLTELEGFPSSYIIGSNNYGDAICLDVADGGTVVSYNHDNMMKRVFMNSSLPLFAETLCAFSTLMRTKDEASFTTRLRLIDPVALSPDSFWTTESASVMER